MTYEMVGRNPFAIIFSVFMDTLSSNTSFRDSTELLLQFGKGQGKDSVEHTGLLKSLLIIHYLTR